jgi:hypothetical protein
MGMAGILSLHGCSAQSVIVPNPPDAAVTVEGKPLVRNVLTYGRWVGNKYNVHLTAPGFHDADVMLSPELGDRAGMIAALCLYSVVGIPFLPTVFWNGELLSNIYISMEQANDKPTKSR